MDTETIDSIAGLWKLSAVIAPLIVVLFVLVIFRDSLRGLLQRATKVSLKGGGTELSISQGAGQLPDADNVPSNAGEVARVEDSLPEAADTNQSPDPQASGDWFLKMIEAARSGSLTQLDAAYKSLQETEHDPREKLANQVIHQYFRYIAGATSAIEELQRLAATPDQSSLAYFWMGTCYEQSDEFEKAACAFKESALASDTPVLRSQRLERAAICLFKSGNRESAFSTIVEEISDAGDREAMASLYNGLASLYKLADDPELRAIALEKALELSPNDVDLLFNAGYAHGEKGSSHLNLLHYKKLLEFRSDHAIGLNNVAIAYANLNMPIRAVTSYKAAVGELSTLAAANLANTFMDAGFKEEAESVLGKAREQGDLHPNVGSSMASLSKKDDDESQTEQQVAKMALEQQRFLRIFGESYFIPADRGDFSGEWHAEDGAATIVSETGDQIVGFRGDAPVKHFDGLVRNRAARITTYTPYKADRTGFAYLSVDGTTLLMMILNGAEEHLFLTLTREA